MTRLARCFAASAVATWLSACAVVGGFGDLPYPPDAGAAADSSSPTDAASVDVREVGSADGDSSDVNLDLLAVTVRTGATANMTGVAAAFPGAVSLSAIGGVSSVPAGVAAAVQGALGPSLGMNAVVWVQPLWQLTQDNTFPSDIQILLGVAQNGVLAAAAFSTVQPSNSFLVLTSGGIDNTDTITWGGSDPAGNPPTSPLLALDARANVLASQIYSLYVSLFQKTLVTGGPALTCSPTYGCSQVPPVVPGFEGLEFHLYNGSAGAITIVQTAISMTTMSTVWGCSGCPYNGTTFAQGPWAPLEEAMNKAWNPKVHDGDSTPGSRSLTLSYPGSGQGCLTAASNGDNNDRGSVGLNGGVVAQFMNWGTGNSHRECGPLPSSVDMQLTSVFSESLDIVQMVVFGGAPTATAISEMPTGGMDGNPSPRTWTVAPGWN